MDEIKKNIEAAKAELAILQTEIATLKARKSIVQCIREAFAQERPIQIIRRKVRRKVVEITITEADFEQLRRQASSSLWIESKLLELKRIGESLWRRVNQTEELKAAIRRAEEAELRIRRLEYEIKQLRNQLRNQPCQVYILDNSGDREIDYPELDDLDGREP